MKSTARATCPPSIPAARVSALPTMEDAVQIMWVYYRDHKQLLIADIRVYRADILAQLMQGAAVEDVFAPYLRPAEPAKSMRRAA